MKKNIQMVFILLTCTPGVRFGIHGSQVPLPLSTKIEAFEFLKSTATTGRQYGGFTLGTSLTLCSLHTTGSVELQNYSGYGEGFG